MSRPMSRRADKRMSTEAALTDRFSRFDLRGKDVIRRSDEATTTLALTRARRRESAWYSNVPVRIEKE